MANTRANANSTLQIMGGKAQVKAYPLTEDELTTLAVVQGGASLFFTIAGVCLGFWLNVSQQLAFTSKDTSAAVVTQWRTLMGVSGWLAFFALMIAAALSVFNHSRVRKIKKRTIHDC